MTTTYPHHVAHYSSTKIEGFNSSGQLQPSHRAHRRISPLVEYTISLAAFKVVALVAHGGGSGKGDAFHPKIYGVTLFLQNTPPSTIFIYE